MRRQDVVNKINSLNGENGHKWVVDTYNSMDKLPRSYKLKMSDAWCAGTVTAVLHSLGYDDIAECSCPKMITKAQKKGIWVENDAYRPLIGDIIFYDWQDNGVGDNQGEADHVGIVIGVSGSTNLITVREGNKSGTIGNRILSINGRYIRGFVTPPYESEEDIHKYKTITDIVDAIINGEFGNGENRKNNLYNYFQELVNNKLSKK